MENNADIVQKFVGNINEDDMFAENNAELLNEDNVVLNGVKMFANGSTNQNAQPAPTATTNKYRNARNTATLNTTMSPNAHENVPTQLTMFTENHTKTDIVRKFVVNINVPETYVEDAVITQHKKCVLRRNTVGTTATRNVTPKLHTVAGMMLITKNIILN